MPRWAFHEDPDSILHNFLLLPLAFGDLQLRYVEPAWSLAVELVMYFLLWVGISRSPKLALICLVLGAAYHVVLLVAGANFNDRYFSIASAVLSYAVGAMVYFHYESLSRRTFASAPPPRFSGSAIRSSAIFSGATMCSTSAFTPTSCCSPSPRPICSNSGFRNNGAATTPSSAI